MLDRATPVAAGDNAKERSFSFVATSRNDDHGGDVLRRTQSFIRCLALQCERHRIRGELVLVDWNPPGARSPLADVLDWPAGSEWFTVKVVTVPHEAHLSLPHARTLSMFQMIAKNIGIRRAAGDFIVATNIDIIFSDELFHWLKTADMNDRTLYRSDRWDIPNEVQLEPGFDRMLQRAREEAIRRNLREGTFTVADGAWTSPELQRVDHMLLHPLKMDLMEIRRRALDGRDVVEVVDRALEETLPEMRRFYLTPNIHLNACGDFTMLSRAAWEDLRGYAEWPVFSWNIDSMILLQAAFNGYSEVTAPPQATHYHIEHSYGSGYTPQGADALWRRMQQRSITVINWEDYRRLTLEMDDDARAGRYIVFNGEQWGMATTDLPVQVRDRSAPAAPAIRRNVSPLTEQFDTTDLVSDRLALLSGECLNGTSLSVSWSEGQVVHKLATPEGPWAYALRLYRPASVPRGASYWIRFKARTTVGLFGFGVLTPSATDFAAEMTSLLPSDGWREIVVHVPISAGDQIVLRNRECGRSELEMTDLEFYWEAYSSELARRAEAAE